jgi:hypothetical protein
VNRATASALLTVALVVGACQPSPSPGGSGSRAPGSTSLEPGMTLGPPPSPTQPDVETPAVLDPTLLEVLPETVAGYAVTEALDEAALALADPALSKIATALDVGLAVDPATGNLVTAHVVRLREGAFDDAKYRQSRDSFDEGACTAAGGITGRAEATIDERTVYVTSCVTALRTYHVWLEDENLLISASSVGEGRYGELLMGSLRVP